MINTLKREIRGKTRKTCMVSFMPKKSVKTLNNFIFNLFLKNHRLWQGWRGFIFIVTLWAQRKKMMNGRAVKSMKLFICEKLWLSPRLGIVWMLAFFLRVLWFSEIMLYPLPDSRPVVISFSSPFTILEKLENKTGNSFLVSYKWLTQYKKKRKYIFPSL